MHLSLELNPALEGRQRFLIFTRRKPFVTTESSYMRDIHRNAKRRALLKETKRDKFHRGGGPNTAEMVNGPPYPDTSYGYRGSTNTKTSQTEHQAPWRPQSQALSGRRSPPLTMSSPHRLCRLWSSKLEISMRGRVSFPLGYSSPKPTQFGNIFNFFTVCRVIILQESPFLLAMQNNLNIYVRFRVKPALEVNINVNKKLQHTHQEELEPVAFRSLSFTFDIVVPRAYSTVSS